LRINTVVQFSSSLHSARSYIRTFSYTFSGNNYESSRSLFHQVVKFRKFFFFSRKKPVQLKDMMPHDIFEDYFDKIYYKKGSELTLKGCFVCSSSLLQRA
jgi:hypothetical protein